MDPIDLLEAEHRLIEHVLDSLESYGRALARGGRADPQRLRDHVRFIRGFADLIHHGKEERILFAAAKRSGSRENLGPLLAAMQRQHDDGRQLTDDLAAAAERPRPWQPDVRAEVTRTVLELVGMLRAHIAEEDGNVFPRIMECLPQDARRAVAAAFERFEADHEGLAANLRALARRLAAS